jgi:hypothetical protein
VPAADATASASRPPRAAACLSAADSGLSDPSASLVVLIMEAGVRKAGHGGAVGSASEPGERGVIFTFDPKYATGVGSIEPRSSSFSFIQLSKISLRGII